MEMFLNTIFNSHDLSTRIMVEVRQMLRQDFPICLDMEVENGQWSWHGWPRCRGSEEHLPIGSEIMIPDANCVLFG